MSHVYLYPLTFPHSSNDRPLLIQVSLVNPSLKSPLWTLSFKRKVHSPHYTLTLYSILPEIDHSY